ncbi:TETRASPANIN/PERIPHERIN-RELATED [Salix viminalis]|uniref:TETRASPANIN/PERIPHERIN-RELATED n=1 Tax=Salix viminalis TaxID=40686 RepID=A0A9Q0NII1_SALVM|nr:TETRASPANIN/PERIPHERIN-RELATED [Salix viminalis]
MGKKIRLDSVNSNKFGFGLCCSLVAASLLPNVATLTSTRLPGHQTEGLFPALTATPGTPIKGCSAIPANRAKAGVLANIRKSWRKVSVINIVILIILVIAYVIGCAAFRNNRRIDNDEPSGEARMTKLDFEVRWLCMRLLKLLAG